MLLTLPVADNIASLTDLLAGTKMQSAHSMFHCLDHHESEVIIINTLPLNPSLFSCIHDIQTSSLFYYQLIQ